MSKQKIRPTGAEGIFHPRNVAKSSFTVNDSSTPPPPPCTPLLGAPRNIFGGAA